MEVSMVHPVVKVEELQGKLSRPYEVDLIKCKHGLCVKSKTLQGSGRRIPKGKREWRPPETKDTEYRRKKDQEKTPLLIRGSQRNFKTYPYL